MRSNIKFAVIAVVMAIAAIGIGTSSNHISAAQTQVPQAKDRFKNLKVLGDIPADQLGKVMNIFSASLGVNCSFCHFTDDFSKDGKEEKDTARKMISMTFGLNKAYFNDRAEVSCNTCHRGSEHPQSRLSLTAVAHVTRPKQPENKPLAADIIAKYIKATGGKSKMSAIGSGTIAVQRVEEDGKTSEPEVLQFSGGKYMAKVNYGKNWVADLWDGSAAAKFGPDGKHRLHADEAEQIKREAQLFLPAGIEAAYTKFDYRFTDQIDGKTVSVLIGTTRDGLRERLSFDVLSGLLVRRVATTPTALGDFVYQVDYSGYRAFGGVKFPTIVKYSMPNMSWTKKVISIKLNAPIADSVFQRPGD